MSLINKYLSEEEDMECPEGQKFCRDRQKCIPVRNTIEGIETYINEASSTKMECMECGHKFKKKLGKKTAEVKCPKCKGYDTDIA